MSQKRIRFILNFTLFLCVSFFNTQLIPFLKALNFDATQRSIILAVNALFAIVFQILFGYLCDHFKSMKKFFILAYGFFLFSGSILFAIDAQPFFFCLMICSIMSSMVKVVSALIETWMLSLESNNFGKYRAIGALGLCIGSPIVGVLIDSFSYIGVIIACNIVSIITLFLSYKCEDAKYKDKIDFKEVLSLFTNKSYMYFVFIYFLIYMVGTADQYVVIDKLLAFKASATIIGIKWAIQSLLEIPFFLYADKILKKYNAYILLSVGIIMYGIKFILYGLCSNAIFIILSASLQIVTLPLIAYTSKLIFKEICPKLKASSQMVAMAIFIGGSAFVTPLITNSLAKNFGYDITLYICGGFVLFPFLLLLLKNSIIKQHNMVK